MMKNIGMQLAWITVSDFDKSVDFYTKTLGMKLCNRSDEYSWAELEGEKGARIGISGETADCPVKAGDNAVLAFTVPNIEDAINSLKKTGANLIGDITIVPDQVKLQLFKDPDGNYGQLAELLGNCTNKQQ